jgi:hypothetical protein
VRLDEAEHGRVAVEHGRQPAVADDEVDEAAQRGVGAGRRGRLVLGRRDERGHLVEHRPGDRQDDVVLRPELVVDRGLRDAELVRDHLQRRAVDAVPVEEPQRRAQHPLAALAARCDRSCHRVAPVGRLLAGMLTRRLAFGS